MVACLVVSACKQGKQPPVESNSTNSTKSVDVSPSQTNSIETMPPTYLSPCTDKQLSLSLSQDIIPFLVKGNSMIPFLTDGTYVLVNPLAYQEQSPKQGEIIIHELPTASNTNIKHVRRIIGLPGDQISIADGTVKINDVPLSEPYLAESPIYSGNWILETDEYFALGDNRNLSNDSHIWGALPSANIIGRVECIYSPPPVAYPVATSIPPASYP